MKKSINNIEYKSNKDYINAIREKVFKYVNDNFESFKKLKALAIVDIFDSEDLIRVYLSEGFRENIILLCINKDDGDIYPLYIDIDNITNIYGFKHIYMSGLESDINTNKKVLIDLLKRYGAEEKEIENFMNDLFIKTQSEEDVIIES